MYPGSLSYALPLLAIACLTGGIGLYALRRPKQPGAITFGWLTTGMTLWSFLYALEILAPTLSAKILAAKLEYFGFTSTPVFWLIFALEYTGHKDWLTPARRMALVTLPILTFGLVLTNEFHQLIWTATSLDPQGYPSIVIISRGFWFWIHTAYSYSLILAGVALYFVTHFQTQPLFRKQMNLMVIGSTVPLVVNAFTLFTPIPLHGFDLTPFTFAFSGVLLSIGLFRFSLIDLMPIAAPLIMENLHDAVIVVDNSRRIVNLNPAAHQWLGVGNEAIGQSILDVLKPSDIIRQYWDAVEAQFQVEVGQVEQHRRLDVTISPLRDSRGKIIGRVIVARDNTREHALLMAEKRRARQMEILNTITRIALETTNFHDMLDTLSEHLGALLGADGAFITLWDEANQRVIPATAYGEFRETYQNMKLEPGENTLTASALREKRTLAVEDVRNTPYMNPRLADDVPTQSALTLPLIANGHKLGAAIIGFNQRHSFTTEEIAIGEQAAAQLALALNKSQLLEIVSHRVVQLSLLQKVSAQLAESLDEMEIYQRTVNAMVEIFGYAEAAVSLRVEDDQLEVIVISGTEDMGLRPGFRQGMGKGIVGHTAETRKPYFTGDIARDPHYFHPTREGSGAAMAAPLLLENQLLGVIYVESLRQDAIIEDDTQTLQTLASHLVTSIQKARLYADARDHLLTMTTLQSVTQTVNSSLELDHVFKTVVQLLKENFGYTYVSIYLLAEETLRLGAQAGYPVDLAIYRIPVTSGVAGRTVRTRQVQFIRNVGDDPTFLRAAYDVDSEICVPLLKNETVLGILNIEANPSHPLDEKDVELLTAIANPVALAIDNASMHAKVTALALTDGMTGLVNRRAFDQNLEIETARAARYGHPLSLIVIDMDSFKQYNDTYGHPAGDERLKVIASLLLANARYPDIAARYGGEEFAVILPHTDKAGALVLAERLRAGAESQAPEELARGGPIAGYTISLGVASHPGDGTTSAELLHAADNAELTAKHLGKNRVCTANHPQETIS